MLTRTQRQAIWAELGNTPRQEQMIGDHQKILQQVKNDLRSYRGGNPESVIDFFNNIEQEGIRSALQNGAGRIVSTAAFDDGESGENGNKSDVLSTELNVKSANNRRLPSIEAINWP